MRKHLSTIILGIVLLAGLSLLLYPTISDYWNSYHQSKAIAGYVQAVDNLDDEKRQKMLEAAQEYNEKLLSNDDRYHMTDEQRESNRRKSKIRCRIEHVFGFITVSMHGLTVRSIGIKRAEFNIGLTNLVYNFCRYTILKRKEVYMG